VSQGPQLQAERRLIGESETARTIREFRRRKVAVASLFTMVVLAAAVILAPVVAPDPIAQDLKNRLQKPSSAHPFGTDYLGRDILGRIIHGGRVSLSVGLIVVAIAMIFSIPIGLVSGYFGGRVDDLLMRLMDALLTFPPMLLALALLASLGPDIKNAMLALGLVRVPRFARLVRGCVISAKENQYVEAARSIGAGDLRIMLFHIWPNVAAPLLVQSTISFAAAILAEAGLSFLGLGVQPPTPSWGRDISEGYKYLREAPWMAIFPMVAIMVSAMSVNLVGDGLRDAMNPRLRGR
jgi:peptide/nickel transport system permease protein